MSTLRETIEDSAIQFAAAIVDAVRSASLDELMNIAGERGRAAAAPAPRSNGMNGAPPKIRGGRLGRRSAEDIARTLDNIVNVLGRHPEGLRAEQIKAALQLDKREMPKPLAEGLASGVLTKIGQKRSTTYYVAGGDGKKSMAPRKRTTKKKGSR